MVCNVRLPSRRGGWRSRERGAVGRRAAVRGFHGALDQVVSQDSRWLFGYFVLAAWWALALVFCRSAYAAPSVEVDGNFAGYENGETYNGYIVVDAPNEYIATLALIGEYSSLVQIDSDMYAKLSNESSGGRFYELVQQWQKLGTNASGTSSNYPTWAGSTYFVDGLVTVYGYGRVWECAVTDALKAGAKQDFLTILDGGDVGGNIGGNPETDDNYYYFEFTNQTIYADSNDPAGFCIDGTTYESLISLYMYLINKYPDETFTLNYWMSRRNNQNYYASFGLFSCEITMDSNCWAIMNSPGHYNYYGTRNPSSRTYNNKKYFIMNYNFTNIDYSANGQYEEANIHRYTFDYSFGGDGEPGDNNWPDDDTPTPPSENPPTPPTINPPSSPNPPTITPHNPTVPTNPTNEPAPTGTTPTDYTPWLRAILQQLVNLTSYLETCFTWLGTALDEHCQHIRDHMTACSQFIGDYVVGGMSSLLGEHHSFLNGLAQWIVDNLKWENSGGEFDDSNMIYWLRRIYARQGSGDVNSRPVDPATDYSGFAGWLGVLYDAVALDVSDTSLVALTSSLTGLQHTFPFSLPWDIKQVLQALDVSPVTPSASIPIYGLEGDSYDVDLHWMDSAMVSVRAFELLVFIVYVMVHTRDLFGYLMGE